jgi:ribonucleoside-diphosphate reductase alpha chain
MCAAVCSELERVACGLPRAQRLIERLLQDPTLRDAPAGEEEKAALAAAQARIHEDPVYERLSCRLLLRRLYREVLRTPEPDPAAYRAGFVAYVRRGVEVQALDARLLRYDLERLAGALHPERDGLLPLVGLYTLVDRYLVRDPSSRALLELPQYLFMRVAMGLSLVEEEPDRWAVAFYEAMSALDFLPSTPTLFNAGTPHHQLSSCYLADVQDSMDDILRSCVEFGQIAKYAGGIGTSITKLRAVGSPVRGINGTSSGIIPFVHLFDALIKAINQGGRRRGTLAVYLEPWHLEIRAFLDLKRNAGDPYLRAPSLNTALWIPDEFLERVERDEAWYLFDPLYTPELTELWGEAFREAYRRRIEDAQSGRIPPQAYRVERARALFREILATLQETSHPWIAFKDASNARSMLPGVIHSSNLCTEVHLPTSPEEVAVCNLASINLVRHLTRDGLDELKLRRTVHLAMRGLDNVIDLNLYPTERARVSNLRHRPVAEVSGAGRARDPPPRAGGTRGDGARGGLRAPGDALRRRGGVCVHGPGHRACQLLRPGGLRGVEPRARELPLLRGEPLGQRRSPPRHPGRGCRAARGSRGGPVQSVGLGPTPEGGQAGDAQRDRDGHRPYGHHQPHRGHDPWD